MRTTSRIREEILSRSNKKAAEEGRTLTSLAEEGLSIVLDAPQTEKRRRIRLPVSRSKSGVLPGVDLNRSSDLTDLMERQ